MANERCACTRTWPDNMASQQEEQPKRKDNRWRLSSPAAEDMRWFWRCAASEFGLRASRLETPAATVILPIPPIPLAPGRKICRRCMLECDEAAKRCHRCKRNRFAHPMRPPEPRMHVSGTPPSPPQSATERNEQIYVAVPRWRRISDGLVKLPSETIELLRVAYLARQFSPEIRQQLGTHAALTMQLPRCKRAYEKYLESWHAEDEKLQAKRLEEWRKAHPDGRLVQTPLPLAAHFLRHDRGLDGSDGKLDVLEPSSEKPNDMVTWLTDRCRKASHKTDGWVKLMRDETEMAIGDALEQYQKVRVRAPNEEPSERPSRGRDSIPFIPGNEED